MKKGGRVLIKLYLQSGQWGHRWRIWPIGGRSIGWHGHPMGPSKLWVNSMVKPCIPIPMSKNKSLKSFPKVCFPQDAIALILHRVIVIFCQDGCTMASWPPSLSDSHQPAPPWEATNQQLTFPPLGLSALCRVAIGLSLPGTASGQARAPSRAIDNALSTLNRPGWDDDWHIQDATLSTCPVMPSVCWV